ncbi:cysteine peptidase family C39 domain-containing protein [Weissella cibaria]|uniref:cysteine peptidase family C39 domain-containing protein n=1 Tax=Weissella cibaria TaxID=137591 RepID=UPI003B501347
MEFFKFYYRRKLQVTLQGEHSECGLAVVNMILNFNDYNTKLMDLRSEYGVPRGGLTLKNMYTILQDYGFKNRALKVSGEEAIAKIPTPAIAFWEQNHYVVIVEVRRTALMSRLWTGFFGTARCRYPEKFSKPGFQPKMA